MLKPIMQELFINRRVRKEVTERDILLFFSIYFPHYITYPIAPFQKEILKLLQNEENKHVAVVAFRNSAKSTFCSLVLPIWSIVGEHQKKHILIVCQTDEKAKQTLANIRQELEDNELLFGDFGAFYSNDDQWNRDTLVIPKYGAKITAVSVGTSIRGTRHKEHRPDLIICDDIEDVQSAKMQESRDKLWQFINGELIPAGTKDTRYVFIGNLVHEDSVMMRIKRDYIKKGSGIYKEYPLVDDEGKIFWPGQFPTIESIESHRNAQLSEIDYLREYRLKIVPDGDRIIYSDDIHRYKEEDLLPRSDFQFHLISIDPAVSEKHTADKTAIIVARVYGSGKTFKIYISPHPINKRMTWPQVIDEVKRIVTGFGNATYKIFIEGGSTQKGLAQILQDEELNAEEVTPQGMDKRTRLSMTKRPLQTGTILFPEYGTEALENQLYTFGTERYDDLTDALTLIAIQKHFLVANLGANAYFLETDMYSYSNAYHKNTGKDWAEEEDADILHQINTKPWRNILKG